MTNTMQEQQDDRIFIDDVEEVKVETLLYGEDCDEIALRQVTLGVDGAVLLEMAQDEEGALVLQYTGSMVDTQEELLEMLEAFTAYLKDAIDQQAGDVEGEVVGG